MLATKDQHNWDTLALDWQKEPPGPWKLWLLLSKGRGVGKTTAAVEWARKQAETGQRKRIALVGPTIEHARHNMIEGSSILHDSRTKHCPRYVSLKRQITWPNGARVTIYGADDFAMLQGVALDGFVADQVELWPDGALRLLTRRLRLGNDPRGVITATLPFPKLDEVILMSSSTYVTHIEENDNNMMINKEKTTTTLDDEALKSLLSDALQVEGAQHKQYLLWRIAEVLEIDVSDASDDMGIAV